MKLIQFFHFVVLIFLALYCLVAAPVSKGDALFCYFIWLFYLGLLCGLMLNNLWCARLLIVPPLFFFLYTAPFVLFNFAAFIMRDPLYLDSPATIFVVAIPAFFVTLPSTLVLIAYWKERRRIFGSGAAT